MSSNEDYVSRTEFNSLKDEVKAIEQEMAESSKLLQAIDKKIDVIDAKIVTAKEIDDLKLTPLEKRVGILEDSEKWTRRTLFSSIVTIIVGAIVFVIKNM